MDNVVKFDFCIKSHAVLHKFMSETYEKLSTLVGQQ